MLKSETERGRRQAVQTRGSYETFSSLFLSCRTWFVQSPLLRIEGSHDVADREERCCSTGSPSICRKPVHRGQFAHRTGQS